MTEIFCGKTPQNDRKSPQNYSANEPYLPPKGDDPAVIEARQRRREQRKIVLETAAAWMWYFLSKGLSVFIRVETWIIIIGVAAVFGVSYAVWLLALWVGRNIQLILSIGVFGFVAFVLSIMIRQLRFDYVHKPDFDDIGDFHKPVQTPATKRTIEIVNYIDTGDGQQEIKITNTIK